MLLTLTGDNADNLKANFCCAHKISAHKFWANKIIQNNKIKIQKGPKICKKKFILCIFEFKNPSLVTFFFSPFLLKNIVTNLFGNTIFVFQLNKSQFFFVFTLFCSNLVPSQIFVISQFDLSQNLGCQNFFLYIFCSLAYKTFFL